MQALRTEITPMLVDGLYAEAMGLATAARRYFDAGGADDRMALDPLTRVAFSSEALRITTRLMHVVAWLMVRKAVDAGQLTAEQAMEPARRLGRSAADGDAAAPSAKLPKRARALAAASIDLHERVARLDAQLLAPPVAHEPAGARALLGQLRAALR